MFQMALLLLKDNNCDKIFCNPYTIVEVMAQTNQNGWMHACMHAHTHTHTHTHMHKCMHIQQGKIETTMSLSPQAGSTNIDP